MSSTLTAIPPSGLRDVLGSAVSELRATLPFDAMQLLRHDPRRAAVGEALRIGYSPDAAWALRHLFVEKYRVGFTRALSPNDGLPPAISSVRPEYRDDFVESSIYRDHLHPQGYRDGISMELFLRGEYIGIAHFSSTRASGFTSKNRHAASAVRGLLAALILSHPADGGTGPALQPPSFALPAIGSAGSADMMTWCVRTATGAAPTSIPSEAPFLLSDRFGEHVEQFTSTGLTNVQHLWFGDGQLHNVELRALPQSGEVAIGVRPSTAEDRFGLSLQELRVLSHLCSGKDDAAIADRLHLSRRTVESHVLNARRKLNAKNRVEAVVKAITTACYLPDPSDCSLEVILGSPASLR